MSGQRQRSSLVLPVTTPGTARGRDTQIKSNSSRLRDGTGDATGRLILSPASRPVTAGRLALDSRSRHDGAGLRAFGGVANIKN